MINRFFRWVRFFNAIERASQRRPQRARLRLEALEDRLAPAVINATWLGGAGNWDNAALWDIGVVPNNGGGDTYNVFIDGGKIANSTVNLNINATIDNLTIDAGDTLSAVTCKSG